MKTLTAAVGHTGYPPRPAAASLKSKEAQWL